MANITRTLLSGCMAALILTGCIKDEEPNIEVDVLEVSSDAEGILNVTFQQGASGIIDVYADAARIDLSDLTLKFVLSDGASITPEPSTVTDYSQPRVFKVTSENRQWEKNYTVRVLFNELPLKYDFEEWMQPEKTKYKIPYEKSGSGEPMYIWACGNPAYNFLAGHDDDYTVFPTQPSPDSHSGDFAAKLMTRTTPELSKPIAAGNLFIGQFDASKREPRESTMFGLPFMKKPVKMTGKYRYRSGGLTYMSNESDQFRIRGVLYRTDSSVKHLNGFTIKDSPNIVARAEMSGGDTSGDGYAGFSIDFVYEAPVDPALLARGGYNFAVIFTSSINGDVYDGAPGSTLWIDDVEIICADN